MERIFFHPAFQPQSVACALADALLIAGTLVLASEVRFASLNRLVDYEGLYLTLSVVTLILLLCAYYNELYQDKGYQQRWTEIAARWLKSFMMTGALLAMVYYAVPQLLLGRGILLMHFPMALTGLLLWRMLFRWLIRRSPPVRVLILGTGCIAKDAAQVMTSSKQDEFRVFGFLAPEAGSVGRVLAGTKVIGTFDDVTRLSTELRIDLVVVALEDRRGMLPVDALLRCRTAGVGVEEAASFYERLTGMIPVRSLRPSWLIFSNGFKRPRVHRAFKRASEFLIACAAIVISLPILLVGAMLVWLDGGRPVLYRQVRVGEEGKRFRLYKLRTMRQDAETESGPVWAASNGDPRITRVGRFLRASRLDELPQLFNVLKGDMSFVGPRPERPCFVDQLKTLIPYYDERHSVKPGITGWAQIKYGYTSNVDEAEKKFQYDLFYIKNMSLFLDIVILLDTAKVVLLGKGAR